MAQPQGTMISGMNTNPTGAFGTNTGSSGNYGYGTSGNPVASGPMSFAPPSMNPFGSPAGPVTGGVGAGSWNNSQLNSPFGSGIGPQIQTFLNSNGGYNSALTQKNVQAMTAEMNRQAMTQYGNLESAAGSAGISPNSSVAALESSNFWSNVSAEENAITAQDYFNMWQSSMGNEVSVLESAMSGSAQRQQQQYTSGFDWAQFAVDAATAGVSSYNQITHS